MYKGMHTENGKAAAIRIANGADAVESLRAELHNAIHGFDWFGPDADRTRTQWDGEQVKDLIAVVGALRGYAQLIRTEAEKQEQASA